MRAHVLFLGGLFFSLLAACGDPATVQFDGAVTAVMDASSTTDSATRLLDAAIAQDAGTTEELTPEETFESYVANVAALVALRCTCPGHLGHDLESLCLAEEVPSSEQQACNVEGYLAGQTSYLPRVSCLLRELRVRAECAALADCDVDDEAACEAAYELATSTCPTVTSDERDAYNAHVVACSEQIEE